MEPLKLIEQRTNPFERRKIILGGTPTMKSASQIEREIAKGHGHDAIERVRITGTNEVTQALIHDVDAATVVESW